MPSNKRKQKEQATKTEGQANGAIPAADQGQKPVSGEVAVKQSFIDKRYADYCKWRTNRQQKKADKQNGEKKKLSKGQIAGGLLIGGAVLGGLAKVAYDHAIGANYADDELDEPYELGPGDVSVGLDDDPEPDYGLEAEVKVDE